MTKTQKRAYIEAAIRRIREMQRLYKNAIRRACMEPAGTYEFRKYLEKRDLEDGLCHLLTAIEIRQPVLDIIYPMISDAVDYHNAIRGLKSAYVIQTPPGNLLTEVVEKSLAPRLRLLQLFEERLLNQLNSQ